MLFQTQSRFLTWLLQSWTGTDMIISSSFFSRNCVWAWTWPYVLGDHQYRHRRTYIVLYVQIFNFQSSQKKNSQFNATLALCSSKSASIFFENILAYHVLKESGSRKKPMYERVFVRKLLFFASTYGSASMGHDHVLAFSYFYFLSINFIVQHIHHFYNPLKPRTGAYLRGAKGGGRPPKFLVNNKPVS